MTNSDLSSAVQQAVNEADGVIELEPAFVARDWLPPGRRLGLSEDEYDVAERGFICERWLGSTTKADNAVGPDDEGISSIRTQAGDLLNLADAVAAAPDLIMGADYARTHTGLGRLAKIYDYAERIPYHIHPPADQARQVGRNSKDEAYYFPSDIPMGAHPETFLGTHPSLGDGSGAELMLAELRAWDSDAILRLSRAYQQMPEDGFFVPSGILHAPGTALTVELQEDSDTLAMFQALNGGTIIDKALLYKDVSERAQQDKAEAALLDWIDWEANADPYFYENHHIAPQVLHEGAGATDAWILYGSQKFSGKRLVLAPGSRYESAERGVFNLLVLRGSGRIGDRRVVGGQVGADELLITHDRAVRPLEYVNDGEEDLIVLRFFGPDINPDSPVVAPYPSA